MFRILKFLLFFALLGGLYGLYQLHAAKQREQEVLAWSNRLIWDALGTTATPRFGGQSVAAGPSDKSWRVTGKLAAKTASGAPMEGDYQAVIAKLCSASDDQRCWDLQALRVGNDVLVAGAGLSQDQPVAIAKPAAPVAPAVTAPLETDAAAQARQTTATAGGGQSAPGNPPSSGQAEKAVVFGLPPPTLAEPSLGFSRVSPAADAQPVTSAAEAAARLAIEASPKAKAPTAPAAPAHKASAPQPGEGGAAPVQQMEAQPVAPVELAGTLETSTAPAAGQAAAPAAPIANGPAITGSEQTAALPRPSETQPSAPQPSAPQPTAPPPAAATAATPRSDPSLVQQTQERLLQLDYGKGRLTRSGVLDDATQSAILSYQYKNGLPGTGQPSYALLQHMDGFLARLNAIANGQARPTTATAGRTAYYAPAPSPASASGGYASFRNGLAAAERGQIDEAIAHYTRAIESTQWRERHMAYLSRGNALAGQGNYRQAINDYSAAIQLRPNYAEAWINRGLAFAKLAQREQALADLRQGQRLDPDNGEAARALRIIESRSQLE